MRLIERVWFQGHLAKYLLVPILLPLSLLFWLVSSLRRLAYRLGLLKQVKLTKPVVVVGNIGIGGNGKTPVAIALIEQCQQLGIKVGVISRGYGGNAPRYPYLLTAESTASEAGDEPYLIYQRCQVPVVVGPDRVAAGQCLIEQGCQLIIADDGMQHYRLARDIELLVVDGKRRFGNGLLLPAGPLREGLWRLNMVDAVIINGVNDINGIVSSFAKSINIVNKPLAMALAPDNMVNMATGKQLTINEFLTRFATVNAVAGIGDPERFFSTLTAQGFILSKQQGFVDHHHFSSDDFTDFDAKIPLVMTEKDAVKCQSFAQQHYWYLTVSAEFSADQLQALTTLLAEVVDAAHE